MQRKNLKAIFPLLLILLLSGFTKVGPHAFEQVESGIYYKKAFANGTTYHIVKVSLYKEKVSLQGMVSNESIIEEGVEKYKYERLSTLATQNNVDVAVNAGFFNPENEFGSFEGTVVVDGAVKHFRPDRAVFAWKEKEAKIGVYKTFDNLPFKENAIGGGPVFIKDGEYDFDPYNEAFDDFTKKERVEKKNARTAIGLDKRGKELVIMVVDGNDHLEVGMTAEEMAEILLDEYDVENAMMLDGGGSSSLIVKGKLTNMPNLTYEERRILNGIGIVSKDL